MGKYSDIMFGIPAPAPEPAPASAGKYSSMLYDEPKAPVAPSTGTGEILTQGKRSFMENVTDMVSPSEGKQAGIVDQAKGSFPTDIKDRAKYFAKQRFPDLSEEEAVAKYGVKGGRLFYEGEDGKYYFEEPKAEFGQLGKFAASGLGGSLPVIGGAVGGLTTAFAGGVPGAAGGAAAGDAARQAIAMGLGGQEEFKPGQTATEAALSAGGQALGAAGIAFKERNLAKDVARSQTPEAKAAIDSLKQEAEKWGLTLTPAELTNLSSLKAQQNMLESLPASSDKITDFYNTRNTKEVPVAIDNLLNKVSSAESSEVGAGSLKSGAKSVIQSETEALKEAAKPYYSKAFYSTGEDGAVTPKVIQPPDKSGGYGVVKSPLGALKRNKTYNQFAKEASSDPILNGAPQDSFAHLDRTRSLLLESMRSLEQRGFKNSTPWRRLNSTQKQVDETIQKHLDPESKTFLEEGRKLYTDGMPNITELTKGEIGLAANKKTTNLKTIPTTVFNSGPMAIAKNRTAFAKAGQEQAWNDGLRAYLSDAFDAASKEYVSGNANPGAKFRSVVFGTEKQKAAMRAAMTPEQWQGFSGLMNVLEASGRVQRGGSRTAFANEAIKDLKKQSGGLVSKTLRTANPSNLLDLNRVATFYDELQMGKHAEILADIVTSPDGVKKLRSLKAMSPRSKKAMAITSQLLTQYGASRVSEPSDIPLGGFSGSNANQRKEQTDTE